VGVEGVVPGGVPLLVVEQLPYLLALRSELVPPARAIALLGRPLLEDDRQRAPARPAGQDRLLLGARRARRISALDLPQRLKRPEVRARPGDLPGRGQVGLTRRPEPAL